MSRPKRPTKKLLPIHPGEILKDALEAAGVSANALALALRVPANRITLILSGKRGITPETALRLGRYFGTSPGMWINLQAKFDLQTAEDELRERIDREVMPHRAA